MNYHEINRYCSPKSLLVVSYRGNLARVSCPFPIICAESIGELKEFERYDVSAVLMTETGSIVFVIDGKSYPHSCCRIGAPL